MVIHLWFKTPTKTVESEETSLREKVQI